MNMMKALVYQTLFISLILCQLCNTLDLPDLGSIFRSYYERTSDLEEIDDVLPKDRVKRQDPGIGDESHLPYEIKASRLPTKQNSDTLNDRYMPVLGNGHIATTVYHDSIFMNGLYDGTGGESHRARIPAVVMSKIRIANDDVENRATRSYHLNAQDGYFMETIDCDFAYIEHKLYIHKHFIRVFVSDIYWRKKSGGLGGGKLLLNYPTFNDTTDIVFGEAQAHYAHFHSTGRTRTAEEGASTQTVHLFWMDPLKELAIQGSDREGNYTVLMAVDKQESDARSEFDEALRIIESSDDGHYQLLSKHKIAWKSLWAKGRIELIGDLQLSKLAYFSQFYILSSLPSIFAYQPPQHSEFLYGVGRTSLGRGKKDKDYEGHVMWDNEVYILPAIVLFHPELVKRALRYRSEMGDSARQIAEDMGAKGFKYPFRSAYTGKEVSPNECLECENRKYHTSADVAWGIRQYYSATRDRDYLINVDYMGCDVTREIARFYADRTNYDPNTGRYSMGEMTGPDETYPDRKNNAYTLVAASLAIHYARYLACECQRNEREEVPDEWIQMALYYDLPFDNVRRLHDQFEGFSEIPSPRINQADAIMLTYPLNWNMSRDIMRHDLEYYEQITNDNSPAMTWSFFTVGWKWVDEHAKRDAFFLKSYQDYLIQPFKIWTEFNEGSVADQEAGSVNFLPGMGGFLQSLVYGFAGIRIRPKMLEFHNPIPPPGCTEIILRSLQYLGSNMTVFITEFQVTIEVHGEGDYPLVLRRNDTTYVEETLGPGAVVVIENPKQGFFIYTNQESGCEHPRDYIYMPWGYSPFIDSATSVYTSISLLIMLLLVTLLGVNLNSL